MSKWWRDLYETEDEVRKKLSSKYYKSRIDLAYVVWAIMTAWFVIFGVYSFYRSGWVGIITTGLLILWIGFVTRREIKALKDEYEQAKLREIWQQKAKEQKEKEQREQKEKENEKQNEIDQDK